MNTRTIFEIVLFIWIFFAVTSAFVYKDKFHDILDDRNQMYMEMDEKTRLADAYRLQLEEAGIKPVRLCP